MGIKTLKSEAAVATRPVVEQEKIHQWISELSDAEKKDNALHELCKVRGVVQNLPPKIWDNSKIIVQEIADGCALEELTESQAKRLCDALALFQCVASHPETKTPFLQEHIPLHLCPLFRKKHSSFEHVQITSLGIIAELSKFGGEEAIRFLVSSDLYKIILRQTAQGNIISKIVATVSLRNILSSEAGLGHICETCQRFTVAAVALGKMLLQIAKGEQHLPPFDNSKLLKYIIECYLVLATNPRAHLAFRQCFPKQLKDPAFLSILGNDDPILPPLAGLIISFNCRF